MGDAAIALAAGGIVTARGLAAVLAAGAAGAWVGTALLACSEALTPPAARQRLIAASELDTVSTSVSDIAQRLGWPPGYRGRALANGFAALWHGHEDDLARQRDAHQRLQDARVRGDFDTAVIYAGQGVGSVSREASAETVISEMAEEAEALLRRW